MSNTPFKPTAEQFAEILRLHGDWLWGRDGGTRADLTGADLTRADLRGAVLRGADLTDAVLRNADLTRADLRGAVLRGAVLRGAVLRGAVLRGADLTDAVLRNADLTGADLTGADLTGAVLTGADLTRADLRGAVLRGADLTDAVLRNADLTDAVLTGAVLTGATLPGPVVWEAYQTELVPALLVAGGRALGDVATPAVWNCHSWSNCPMRVAFGADNVSGVPALYRAQANLFISLFDAGLIPLNTVRVAGGLPPVDETGASCGVPS